MKEIFKIMAIGVTVTRCTMTVGITMAAMYFNKPAILCWYILVACMGAKCTGGDECED